MKPEKILALSDMIIEGNVMAARSRWITKSMIVTEYTIRISEVFWDPTRLFGLKAANDTLILTFAGGEVNGEGVWIPGVPEFIVGEQVIFLISRQNVATISPLVGLFQGFYRVKKSADAQWKVFSWDGTLVRRSFFSNYEDQPTGISPKEFLRLIQEAVPRAKSDPLLKDPAPFKMPYKSQEENSLGRDTLHNTTSVPKAVIKGDVFSGLPSQTTRQGPMTSKSSLGQLPNTTIQNQQIFSGRGGSTVQYAFNLVPPDAPAVFNVPPRFYGSPNWGLAFENSLADWNRYASGVFVRSTNSDNSTGRNNRFDFDMMTPQQLHDVYGVDMDPVQTLAITVVSTTTTLSGRKIVEADIILNAFQNWTLDFGTAYNSSLRPYFRSTVIHELGHAFGRMHQFEETLTARVNSVMNYPPAGPLDTEFSRPFMDDAESIRFAYGSRQVSISDLGVYLFNTNGGQGSVFWSTFPSSVRVGESFTVRDVIIENLGTSAQTPTVVWYLSDRNHTWSGANYYAVGIGTFSSVPRFHQIRADVTISLPSSVPAGQYYIVAELLSDDNDLNRDTWSNSQITLNPPSTVNVTAPAAGTTWTVGTTQTVSWTSTGVTGNVNIKLSTDGGTSFPTTLVSNTANDGNQQVTVPNLPSSTCRVRVESVSDPSVRGDNSGDFTIQVADVVTITSRPSGSPNPVASGGQASCSVSASDSRGHWLTYSWSATGGSFPSPNVQNPTWNAPRNFTNGTETYTIRVTVTCTGGQSQTDEYQQGVSTELVDAITITSVPSGTPNPVAPGGQVNCSVSASDSRGHWLSYNWSATGGSFSNPNNQNPVWTAPQNTGSTIQTYTLTVRVTCAGGQTQTGSYQQGVNPEMVNVWPGDADNNGAANIFDINRIVATYWQRTGPSRPNASLNWVAQSCQAWTPREATYADCSGDGTVNIFDINAVVVNFGRTHPAGSVMVGEPSNLFMRSSLVDNIARQRAEPLMIAVAPQQASSGKNFWVEVKIGTSTRPVTNLKVVSFELIYTSVLEYIGYEIGSFLDGGQAIVVPENVRGRLSASIFRMNGGSSGSGVALRLEFRVPLSATNVEPVRFSFGGVQANREDGSAQPLMAVGEELKLERTTATPESSQVIPAELVVMHNYPNPFNPSTTLRFAIPLRSRVRLTIHNALGQVVAVLRDEVQEAGYHEVRWETSQSGLASGLYFSRLDAVAIDDPSKRFTQIRKMLLVK